LVFSYSSTTNLHCTPSETLTAAKMMYAIVLLLLVTLASGFRMPSGLGGLGARLSLARNYKTFDEFLESQELPVLVDFYAEW
jgi:hypothetical protein